MAEWEFSTKEFRDAEAVLRRNVNGIGGAALAQAVRERLEAGGYVCGEVFPEDFGWAFFAAGPEGRYLCAFSLEAGEGGAQAGHALVARQRNLRDRLLGRNRETPDEGLPRAVEAFLRSHPAIRDLA